MADRVSVGDGRAAAAFLRRWCRPGWQEAYWDADTPAAEGYQRAARAAASSSPPS